MCWSVLDRPNVVSCLKSSKSLVENDEVGHIPWSFLERNKISCDVTAGLPPKEALSGLKKKKLCQHDGFI